MAQRKIIWTETAARQRRIILEYWLLQNKSSRYSLKLLRLSEEKSRCIAKNPLMYRKAEFPDTHVAAMGHYSMFYKVTKGDIIITAFWDNRQDPKRLIELLQVP